MYNLISELWVDMTIHHQICLTHDHKTEYSDNIVCPIISEPKLTTTSCRGNGCVHKHFLFSRRRNKSSKARQSKPDGVVPRMTNQNYMYVMTTRQCDHYHIYLIVISVVDVVCYHGLPCQLKGVKVPSFRSYFK